MNNRDCITGKSLSRNDLIELLSLENPEEIEQLRKNAENILLSERGNQVYFRGLIEFSNICRNDCYYCGIRKSNNKVKRYSLSEKQVVDAALWCAKQGYGSIVLQSGERNDSEFVDTVERLVYVIKEKTVSAQLPDGLGITLCVGEHTFETYKRFFAAGAHRYLLRIETSSEDLFSRLHPQTQKIQSRIDCLKYLKEIGYFVGTGVMIGMPGQTIESLADDILFFKKTGVDMIGMGPYIPHSDTPLGEKEPSGYNNLLLSLKMIAVTRLVLKDINIAATTALQALKHNGRELGLRFGANVVMPQLTPKEVRKEYMLYDGKPCTEESRDDCSVCLKKRILSTGRIISLNNWGDRVRMGNDQP